MIYKFTTPDIFNTNLVDDATNQVVYQISTESSYPASKVGQRTSHIRNANDSILAQIEWEGRLPVRIIVGDEKIGGMEELFGYSTTANSAIKMLSVPAHFDTECNWVVSPGSITLVDGESETTKGRFHRKSIRLGERFVSTHLRSLGHDYLEFESHTFALDVELVVSFLMMEILRRGCFGMNPYVFNRADFKPIGSSGNARAIAVYKLQSLGQKLRRDTI